MVTGSKTQNNAETWMSGVTMPTVQCEAWGVRVDFVQRDHLHRVSQNWSYSTRLGDLFGSITKPDDVQLPDHSLHLLASFPSS